MTWAAVGIGALIGGGTAYATGGNVLEGAALGGVTGGGGAYMNGLLSGSASGAAGAVPSAGTSMASTMAPAAESATQLASQGGAMTADQWGGGLINSGAIGSQAANTAASNAGALTKAQMDEMLMSTGNMTMPAPSFMDKMRGLMPGEVDPNSPEGALARYALPKEKAGYGQQLTSGLLATAPSFKPNERQERPPASGPALSRPAPQPAGNMYMKFDRWRK